MPFKKRIGLFQNYLRLFFHQWLPDKVPEHNKHGNLHHQGKILLVARNNWLH